MDNTVTIITLNGYFKPATKLDSIERYQVEKNIKRVYNRILDIMADKTINFLDNL